MTREYTAQEMRELADSDDFAAYLYDDPKRCPDPDFAEDDITPMVKDMLRQAADDLGRERRYEYAVEYYDCGKWFVYKGRLTLAEARKWSSEPWGTPHRIVRREVGKWEVEEWKR